MEKTEVYQEFQTPDLLSYMLFYHEITEDLKQHEELMRESSGSLRRIDAKITRIEQRLKKVGVRKRPKKQPIPTKSDILSLLQGSPMPYEYALKLASPLPPILSKGKMFNLNIMVKNCSHSLDNSVSFPLRVELYSSGAPPKLVQNNVRGKPVLVSVTKLAVVQFVERKKCHVSYAKVRINEVTSHYPNGWVFLVVKPDPLAIESSGLAIKPLVIQEVIVKAKRSLREESD